MTPQLHLHILAIMVSCCFFLLPCNALPFIPQLLSILHFCSSNPHKSIPPPSNLPPYSHAPAQPRNAHLHLKKHVFLFSLVYMHTSTHNTHTSTHTWPLYKTVFPHTHISRISIHTMATPTPHTCTHTHWRVLKRKRPVPCEFAYSKRVCYSRHAGADETTVVSFYTHPTHTQHTQQPTHTQHDTHHGHTLSHIHTPYHLGYKKPTSMALE